MEQHEWLAGLTVGSVVACMGQRGQYHGIRAISGETKLYWLVGKTRYRKRDGQAPGEHSMWGRASIEDPESEHVRQNREQSRRSIAASKIREANFKGLTADQLESVVAYIEGLQKKT